MLISLQEATDLKLLSPTGISGSGTPLNIKLSNFSAHDGKFEKMYGGKDETLFRKSTNESIWEKRL